jgi:hypothetical protein
VGRLETVKRVDLAIRAMQHVSPGLSLVIAGTGTHAAALRTLADSLGIASRVKFLGEVSSDDLINLYAGALAVVFPPFDEDYGYVTLEAFLAHKPVVTTTDAGWPQRVHYERRERLGHPRRIPRRWATPSARSIATGARARVWAMRVTIWRAASPGPA